MFGIGMPEMILILAVALIVIGPKKLPDLAKSLGKAMGEFKKATSDLKESMQIDTELKDVKTAFDDIGKEGPTETKIATGEADDAPLSDETPVPGQANDGDSMDQLKSAFKRQNEDIPPEAAAGDTNDGEAPASDGDPDSDKSKG